MNTNTGGPAFPGVEYKAPIGGGSHMMTIVGGMTLRDYFAAKALSGLVVNGDNFDLQKLTAYSYEIADAMLRAREAT